MVVGLEPEGGSESFSRARRGSRARGAQYPASVSSPAAALPASAPPPPPPFDRRVSRRRHGRGDAGRGRRTARWAPFAFFVARRNCPHPNEKRTPLAFKLSTSRLHCVVLPHRSTPSSTMNAPRAPRAADAAPRASIHSGAAGIYEKSAPAAHARATRRRTRGAGGGGARVSARVSAKEAEKTKWESEKKTQHKTSFPALSLRPSRPSVLFSPHARRLHRDRSPGDPANVARASAQAARGERAATLPTVDGWPVVGCRRHGGWLGETGGGYE